MNRPLLAPPATGLIRRTMTGLLALGLLLARAQAASAAWAADAPQAPAPSGLTFRIAWKGGPFPKPLSGRLYVMTAEDDARQAPRFGPNWFRPEPFFARDFTNWNGETPLVLDGNCDGFPGPLAELKPARYQVQAVVRVNRDTHKIGDGAGNVYGPVVTADLDPKRDAVVALTVDSAAIDRPFQETSRVKLVETPSPLLSAFHKRPIKHRAAVILPKGVEKGSAGPKRPALYIIPGFGGDHTMAFGFLGSPRLAYANELVRIVLDPDCGTGHHVFADSANNGPRGQALVEEFIPYIEKTFPIVADPRARLLNGHSSGGWSSLWLQVAHPGFFGGVWSTAPDPVDFRDFQRINIYAPGENMFRDRAGERRPIARRGGTPMLFFEPFSRMDDVIGWGGQLGSFEAVFSPRGADGTPRKLWDRGTGRIDPETAKSWEAYDIRLVLERDWAVLEPQLRGKLHVITGGLDTFYLEGAVGLLQKSLAKLGSDAQIEIVPGRDHGSLLDAELARRLDAEMTARVKEWLPPSQAE